MLELFQRHVERPENTVRWRWRVGDVAIWDNRATRHYGVDDSDDHERFSWPGHYRRDVPSRRRRPYVTLLSPESVPGRSTASRPAPPPPRPAPRRPVPTAAA
ncbi:TauD/TfdA dioxygenase family protein [Streptomyces sp. KL116D]|uniref:TauD/TfdA dioxygenase family protein n=1 Tax=Streptomyces sp. KL116D TaxID=3045152 RepID=UPI00355717AB